MKRFANMERHFSYSMPQLPLHMPLSYVSRRNRSYVGRGRTPYRNTYIQGMGPFRLVGSSPSHRLPQRLILCTPYGSFEKVTRSSSVVELSRSGVYRSREDMRDARAERRAASCEDVYRAQSTCWDSSRFSESGVSVNCSHTDDGSYAGVEEDAVSQSSFGSSSAFCEITCDSELDRPDSDCVSMSGSLGGSERVLDVLHEESARERHTDRASGQHKSKHKGNHSNASHNGDSDASSVKSGEFFHSTPTKKGSLSLSIFPADDDLQLIDRTSPTSSLPTSPRSSRKTSDKAKTKKSSRPESDNGNSARESIKRSREQFFSSLQDCTKLDELSAGDSIQTWVSTGHRPPGVSDWVNDLPVSTRQRQQQQQQNQHRTQPQTSSPSSPTGARVSVSERVKALENGRSEGRADGDCTKGTDAASSAALAETGEAGSALFSSRQLKQAAPRTASQTGASQRGGGGYEIGNLGTEAPSTTTSVNGKVSQGEKQNRGREVGDIVTTTTGEPEPTERVAAIRGTAQEEDKGVTSPRNEGLTSDDHSDGVKTARSELSAGDVGDGGNGTDCRVRTTVYRPALFTADSQTNTAEATCEEGGALSQRVEVEAGKTVYEEQADVLLETQQAEATRTVTLSPYDRNISSCDIATPNTLPPSSTAPTSPTLEQQVVTPPRGEPALSVNMSNRRNQDFLPPQRADDALSREPGARFVDRSEEYDEPSIKIREVRRTHTRHIHRTTVQQIVTTHRTLQHSSRENTPQSLNNSYVNGDGEKRADFSSGGSGDIVTDRTVSTVLREEDSDSTETCYMTQQHLAHSSHSPGVRDCDQSLASLPTRGSVSPGVHRASETSQRQFAQPQNQQQQYTSIVTATTSQAGPVTMSVSPNVSLLDSLQEQLSRLSSDDANLSSSFDAGAGQGQVWGYRDHAEASLPHNEDSGTVVSTGESDSKSRVRGTGSVFITLDKSGVESSALVQSSPLKETVSSKEDGARSKQRERSTASHQHGEKVTWRPPASSSSELDESDGNYSSISTTESSQYPLAHTPLSESDCPPSEGPEDYDNIHSFHDFVSGLQGQSTSDQPSARHSPDVLVSTDFRSGHLRSPAIQETILEADDESESADEADTTLSNFKTSLHFSVSDVPSQSTPTAPSPSQVPQIKLWSADQRVTTLSPSSSDLSHTLSPVNPLQELSERLASISSMHDVSDRVSTISDTSYEVEQHMSHTMDSTHLSELDASLARMSSCSSPAPSDVSEGSVYSSVGFAEIKKTADTQSSRKARSSETKVRRNLASTFKSLKESEWVVEKRVLFERLLLDFDRDSKPQTHVMFDELCSYETQQREGAVDAQTDACDDLYRAFTREDLEKRQNHTCPVIDHQIMPVFRFKRFLRKNHCSKLKGKRRFKILHKMDKLAESPSHSEGVSPVSERQKPYGRVLRVTPIGKPSDSRLPSDVFTEEDLRKSNSDSAYSTMSSVSSRNFSDLDSMVSVSSQDSDKLSALSDVFDMLDVCEGEIDQARLDRLRSCHYSYAPPRRSHPK